MDGNSIVSVLDMDFENSSELTIARLSPLIRRRRISPVELTKFLLERISLLQPAINAYITVTERIALAQARKAEEEIARGRYRGVLHGIPISLKDIFCTRGIRTTAGSRILARSIPPKNAVVVDRLFEAGCVLLGKTNMHEFAYGATNINPHYGPVRNPWDTSRISGGSSGGSAASVISAQAIASFGTDTGGSIRIPSAACGCVGFKPTHGWAPLGGVIPLAPSLDHVGPLCRCVADAAFMFEAVAGQEYRHASASGRAIVKDLRKGVRNLRIGLPRQYFFDRIQSDVKRTVLAAIEVFEQLGARVREVDLEGMEKTTQLAADITAAEALPYHGSWIEKKARDYGKDVRSHLQQSKTITFFTYFKAQGERYAYTKRFERILNSVSLLAVPTLPVVAPRIDQKEVRIGRALEDTRLALLRLTRPANLTGLPAISVPCGFSREGLPVGLQLIGRRYDEATVLRAAYDYEQATPWHEKFPNGNSIARTIHQR